MTPPVFWPVEAGISRSRRSFRHEAVITYRLKGFRMCGSSRGTMRQLFGGRTECEYQARVCNRCNYMVRQYQRLYRSRNECSSGVPRPTTLSASALLIRQCRIAWRNSVLIQHDDDDEPQSNIYAVPNTSRPAPASQRILAGLSKAIAI